jgi:hypothetical protein
MAAARTLHGSAAHASSLKHLHAYSHTPCQAVSDGLARMGGSDGALTWEVPPALELDYGTGTAASPAAVDAQAPGPAAGSDAPANGSSSDGSSNNGDGCSRAANPGDSSGGDALGGPLMGSLSARVHPLVVRARRELAAAAHAHLRALIKQLLRAEAVGGWRDWLPIVERLALEAAATVSPGSAAQHGELDPRYYVKVGRPGFRSHILQSSNKEVEHESAVVAFSACSTLCQLCVVAPPDHCSCYAQVKRLPDSGSPKSSAVVRGVAARKNIAHRRMRSVIENPQVRSRGPSSHWPPAFAACLPPSGHAAGWAPHKPMLMLALLSPWAQHCHTCWPMLAVRQSTGGLRPCHSS